MYNLNNISERKEFGNRIKTARKKANLSQDKFAEKLEMSRSTIANWETGINIPEYEALNKICDILKVDAGYLFGEYKEKDYPKHCICMKTGLSENAVEQLIKLNSENKRTAYTDILSLILDDSGVEYPLALIGERISLMKKAKTTKESPTPKELAENRIKINVDGLHTQISKSNLIDALIQTDSMIWMDYLAEMYYKKYTESPAEREMTYNSHMNNINEELNKKVKTKEITIQEYVELSRKAKNDWFNDTESNQHKEPILQEQ